VLGAKAARDYFADVAHVVVAAQIHLEFAVFVAVGHAI
jgi:hypothetical protein